VVDYSPVKHTGKDAPGRAMTSIPDAGIGVSGSDFENRCTLALTAVDHYLAIRRRINTSSESSLSVSSYPQLEPSIFENTVGEIHEKEGIQKSLCGIPMSVALSRSRISTKIPE